MNRADLDRWKAWAEGRGALAAWESPQTVAEELLAAIPPQPAVDAVLDELESVASLEGLIREVRDAERAADKAESAIQDVGSDIGRLARALEELNRDRAAHRSTTNPAGRP